MSEKMISMEEAFDMFVRAYRGPSLFQAIDLYEMVSSPEDRANARLILERAVKDADSDLARARELLSEGGASVM